MHQSNTGLCTCVDVEEVVAGHAGLAGQASGDDHQLAALQGGRQLVGAGVGLDLRGAGVSEQGICLLV